MQRFELRYPSIPGPATRGHQPVMQSLNVPDIATALVVADIVGTGGTLEIRHGEALVAKVKKQASKGAPFWLVG